jgi:hypothetical protein
MKLRPTLTTTTDPALLDEVQAIQTAEQRTRASVVQELLTLGLKARGKVLARVGRGHASQRIAKAVR